MSEPITQRAVEAIFRIESAKLIGHLARNLRDVDLAEELAQEAFVAALEHWPRTGVPDNSGAWLMATAKRRGIDRLRHVQTAEQKKDALSEAIELQRPQSTLEALEAAMDDPVGDDLLSLMLVACHPVLSPDARAALTLRLLGGLSTAEIARAYLTSEPTIAQRIVRAKRTLGEAKVAFEVPRGGELEARLGAVLEVLYLIFNEGYSATSGDDWIRPALCEEALRLGRILASLVPGNAEGLSLLALMELQASRLGARTSPTGEPVLLLDQNRARWDRAAITRGLQSLDRAVALGGPTGPYRLQAEIAACHARALTPEATDWKRIAGFYEMLGRSRPSPIIELNRAVAVGMAEGPAAALELVDALLGEPLLAGYHLLPSVRGDLLEKLGRRSEARAEYERAAGLTGNARERELLQRRARDCGG